MARFLIVWSVFSVRKWSAQLSWRYRPFTGYGQKAVRRVGNDTNVLISYFH
ncbi:hypothetical protein WH002_05745 [Klebsiella michiganensis]